MPSSLRDCNGSFDSHLRQPAAGEPLAQGIRRKGRARHEREFRDGKRPFDSHFASLRPANRSLRAFEVRGGLAMSEPFGSPKAS